MINFFKKKKNSTDPMKLKREKGSAVGYTLIYPNDQRVNSDFVRFCPEVNPWAVVTTRQKSKHPNLELLVTAK